jgi:hypothetical protein
VPSFFWREKISRKFEGERRRPRDKDNAREGCRERERERQEKRFNEGKRGRGRKVQREDKSLSKAKSRRYDEARE